MPQKVILESITDSLGQCTNDGIIYNQLALKNLILINGAGLLALPIVKEVINPEYEALLNSAIFFIIGLILSVLAVILSSVVTNRSLGIYSSTKIHILEAAQFMQNKTDYDQVISEVNILVNGDTHQPEEAKKLKERLVKSHEKVIKYDSTENNAKINKLMKQLDVSVYLDKAPLILSGLSLIFFCLATLTPIIYFQHRAEITQCTFSKALNNTLNVSLF